jgi:GNAT superfamily N-acetyltransferase
MTTPRATGAPPYDYAFISPSEAHDWRAYHDIRRIVLFDARGVPYNEDHPDEHASGHHPKLLIFGSEPIGVVRIDIDGLVALLRRVAICPGMQRRGHGRVLLARAEQFAREHGCEEAQSCVASDAVRFYGRCGFTVRQEAVVGPSGRTAVLMFKRW